MFSGALSASGNSNSKLVVCFRKINWANPCALLNNAYKAKKWAVLEKCGEKNFKFMRLRALRFSCILIASISICNLFRSKRKETIIYIKLVDSAQKFTIKRNHNKSSSKIQRL